MKILFVCKFNRFRSKIAEGFFNKLNTNKNDSAKSAGIFEGYPISKNVKNIAKELKIKLSKKPNGLGEKDLEKYDHIIIVANNVSKEIFNDKRRKRKLTIWKIRGATESDSNSILKISKEIEKKVKNLVGKIK